MKSIELTKQEQEVIKSKRQREEDFKLYLKQDEKLTNKFGFTKAIDPNSPISNPRIIIVSTRE